MNFKMIKQDMLIKEFYRENIIKEMKKNRHFLGCGDMYIFIAHVKNNML